MEKGTEEQKKISAYTHDEILMHADEFGQKAVRLAKLVKSGYHVPLFVGVGKTAVALLVGSEGDNAEHILSNLAESVIEKVGAARYAIRSSAYAEDGMQYSHAGAFMTKLDVPPEGIGSAIRAVLTDAREKGQATDASPFSLLVQEYISPDIAGVIFTRNPLGGHETVVEWKKGNGLEVVGGGASNRIVFPCDRPPRIAPFLRFVQLIENAKIIEKEEGFPQDIEWASLKGELYILQTRPITTISAQEYKALQFLDSWKLPPEYYFDGTTLMDSFFQPLPLAREILVHLYGVGGAIARAYERLRVVYTPQDIFQAFNTSVFIDKEKELQQFFPTHSYFGMSTLAPHFKTVKGIWTTLTNMYHLGKLPFDSSDSLRAALHQHTEKMKGMFSASAHFSEWFETINDAYVDVFLINILAEKACQDLSTALRGVPYSTAEMLTAQLRDVNAVQTDVTSLKGIQEHLLGNSLNISDESPFRAHSASDTISTDDTQMQSWWTGLSKGRRTYLQKKIHRARQYEVLREEGRWVTVMCISGLREALWRVVAESGLTRRELAYFATYSEIKMGALNEEVLVKRRWVHEEGARYTFPAVIASSSIPLSREAYGVSTGTAKGELVRPGSAVRMGSILLTDTLDPGLTIYFDRISGILSRQGGVLSHLAIVAREYHIPVVVAVQAGTYTEGQCVEINGGTGAVTRL